MGCTNGMFGAETADEKWPAMTTSLFMHFAHVVACSCRPKEQIKAGSEITCCMVFETNTCCVLGLGRVIGNAIGIGNGNFRVIGMVQRTILFVPAN